MLSRASLLLGMMMRRVNLKIEGGHGGLFWRKLQHPVADQAGD
jgi:hypothetical protein